MVNGAAKLLHAWISCAVLKRACGFICPILCPLGSLQKGLDDYNKALSIDEQNVDALYYRGTIYEKQGKLDEAIKEFTAALQLYPDHVKATYARAAC